MLKIVIRTSTRLPAAQIAEVSNKLSHVFAETSPSGAICEIIHDPDAPTLETYGQVGRAVVLPAAMVCEQYANCLGSLATGFTASDVAYAAYLGGLNAWMEEFRRGTLLPFVDP
jgi:hypothetical protein